MTTLSLVLTTLGIGVSFGWTPAGTTEPPEAGAARERAAYEYLVQITEADLEAIRTGKVTDLRSYLPAGVGPFDRVRVVFGENPLPQRLSAADASSPRSIAARGAVRHTVAKPVIPSAWRSVPAEGDPSQETSDPQQRTAFQNPGTLDPNQAYPGMQPTNKNSLLTENSLQNLPPPPTGGANPYGQPTAPDPGFSATNNNPYPPETNGAPGSTHNNADPYSDPNSGPNLGNPSGSPNSSGIVQFGQPSSPPARGYAPTNDYRFPNERGQLTPVQRGANNPTPTQQGTWNPSHRADGQGGYPAAGSGNTGYDPPPYQTNRSPTADANWPAATNPNPATRPYSPPPITGPSVATPTAATSPNTDSTGWGNAGEFAVDNDRNAGNERGGGVTSGDVWDKILLVGLAGMNVYVWLSYIDVRNKYRSVLRTNPSGYDHSLAA